jgi:hypothetical protein
MIQNVSKMHKISDFRRYFLSKCTKNDKNCAKLLKGEKIKYDRNNY